MLNTLVFVSLSISRVTADGEEFIRHVEESIEQVKDTFEQKQRLTELENVFAYGDKFGFKDKLVDLNQYYGEENIEEIDDAIDERRIGQIRKFDEIAYDGTDLNNYSNFAFRNFEN